LVVATKFRSISFIMFTTIYSAIGFFVRWRSMIVPQALLNYVPRV